MKAVPKTAAQKLSDLEDHLFLLNNALSGLDAGQGAHLRQIAAELRVLICRSNRIEGLLWRLVDELHASDHVQIHQVGNVDPTLPLAQELTFAFVPLHSPGRGSPLLPVTTYSLRDLIKTHEAVYVASRGVTHETLIKWLAQQVGSAHEADAIGPTLAELNAILIANVQPFFQVLRSDSVLAIDVGERVLYRAAIDLGYHRKHPSFAQSEKLHLRDRVAVTVPMAAPTVDPALGDEGTVSFLLNPPDPNWMKYGVFAPFAPNRYGQVAFEAVKTSDGFLNLIVTGLFVPWFTRRWPLPHIDEKGLRVHVGWKRPEISVYLNGVLVETFSVGEADPSLSPSPLTARRPARAGLPPRAAAR
jgi:hypothetical protein